MPSGKQRRPAWAIAPASCNKSQDSAHDSYLSRLRFGSVHQEFTNDLTLIVAPFYK